MLLLHLAATARSGVEVAECFSLGVELNIAFGKKLVEVCVAIVGGEAIMDVAAVLEAIHKLEGPNCSHAHCRALLSRQQRSMAVLASKELVAACPGMLAVVEAEMIRLEHEVAATAELAPPMAKGPYASRIHIFYDCVEDTKGAGEIPMASLPKAREAAKHINALSGIHKYLTACEVRRGASSAVKLNPSNALQAHRVRRSQVADLHVLRGLVNFATSKRRKV